MSTIRTVITEQIDVENIDDLKSLYKKNNSKYWIFSVRRDFNYLIKYNINSAKSNGSLPISLEKLR